MKKTICLIFIFLMLTPLSACCSPLTSENAFEIPIMDVPPGGGNSDTSSGGLSNGAVTAIALGSVFGGLAGLGGIGWYFAKHAGALTSGYACGCNSPYSTIVVNNDLLCQLQNDPCKNKYLIKAFENISPESYLSKKYLLIKDTQVTNKTYNTVFFELPEFQNSNEIKVKIIQISEPFNFQNKIPTLNTKIMLNPNDKNVKEIPTTVLESNYQNGLLIKQGKIKNLNNKTAAVVTEYSSGMKKSQILNYALIIEFSN